MTSRCCKTSATMPFSFNLAQRRKIDIGAYYFGRLKGARTSRADCGRLNLRLNHDIVNLDNPKPLSIEECPQEVDQ